MEGKKSVYFATLLLSSLFLLSGCTTTSNNTTPTDNQKSTNTSASAETSQPKIEKREETEIQKIPYEKTMVNDANLESGKTALRVMGIEGTKTITYEVTLTDGIQTDKKVIKEVITTQPVKEVMAIGTKVVKAESSCDPNYSGCVPIDSDVDCASGSGNGPSYVDGPVRVIGRDIYKLDNDKDGVGCE